jgi:hypothetical protein
MRTAQSTKGVAKVVTKVGNVAILLLASASLNCAAPDATEPAEVTETVHAALTSTDPVPCAARALAVVGNTSNVILGGGTRVDSFQSSLGAYGGSNVGSAAIVQAATSITNNGAVVRGTLRPNTPAGLAVVPVASGARNLPIGSPTPGSLNINTAAQSITLAPGNYVAANITVNAPGAIRISPAGQVRIWVTGSLNLGGNLNLGGIPKNLALLVNSAGFVNINGGGALHGIVYAPTSGVNASGPVFGTVVGRSVTLNSGAAVHFDQSSACAPAPSAQVDQSFTTPFDLSAGLYGLPVFEAQSYTAGITGTLQGVALNITAVNPTLSARIQIRAITAAGVPSNTTLGQTRANPGNLSLSTVIPFSTAIPQVAGQQYAILVDYPEAPPFEDGIIEAADWNGATGNAYAGGTLMSSFDNGATWQSFAADGFDVHFRTFVLPN